MVGSRDYLAYCGSFSKVLSPGLRVGWLIGPKALLANATMCKQFSDTHTSNLTQAICAYYLGLGRMSSALEVVRRTYAERADVMAQSLNQAIGDAMEYDPPKGGMFFWARLTGRAGKTRLASELATRAIEQGVAFVPGAPFFAHDPDRKSTRLNSSHSQQSRMPSSA